MNPLAAGAALGVVMASGVHWILFTFIEHGQIKNMNEKQRSY